MKLEISLFKFDCKSDYLPYYKKYFIDVKKEMSLFELLNKMNEVDEFSFENNLDSSLVLNGKYVDLSLTCGEIVKSFGKDLVIEPLSIKRSYSDLLIDDSDFKNSIKLLEEFTSLDEINNLNELKKYHYATNSFNHNKDFIGDAFLFLAYDLIKLDSLNEDKILALVSSVENGIIYHTDLSSRVYNYDSSLEEKIVYMKRKINKFLAIDEQNYRTNNTKKINFQVAISSEIKHSFEDFSIAYYHGGNCCSETSSFIDSLSASRVTLDLEGSDIAMGSYHEDEEFAISLASSVMLEAFDKNCDFLVVDNDQTFYMFDYNRKVAENICGREINIPILHINELKNLAYGNFDEVKDSFSSHILKPQMI